MSVLNAAARAAITSGRLAHLVTLNPDGSPQVSVVWVGLDGDEIVSGHLDDRQKLRNVRRDPRVVLSLDTGVVNAMGLGEYLVVRGTGRVTEGGAAALLQRLAHVLPRTKCHLPARHRPSARNDLAHSTRTDRRRRPVGGQLSRSERAGVTKTSIPRCPAE